MAKTSSSSFVPLDLVGNGSHSEKKKFASKYLKLERS